MRFGRRALLRLLGAGVLAVACGQGEPQQGASAPVASGPIRIAYGSAARQFGDLRTPAGRGPYPVVIVIHGGYWLAASGLTYMDSLADALTKEGVATWNVEYRALGNDGGGWPGTFLDVGAAADALRGMAAERRLDLGHVTALGHSAGGQLALWLAGRARIASGPLHADDPLRIARAISIAGVADLRAFGAAKVDVIAQLLGGGPDAVPERYAAASPIELLPLGVPQVLLHGTADTVVPFAMSERYVEIAKVRGDDATLIPLPGIDHRQPVDPASAAWPEVRAAVGYSR